MFFSDFVQRRLASVLQPWLRDEPDLQFNIGFLHSSCTIKNFHLNTAALNELLDGSARYRFKDVSVRELSARLSYWSFPAFTFRLHGLQIKISLGEDEAEEETGDRRRRKANDTYLEDKRKVLTEIDPEGCALHDAIERISNITIGSWRDNIVTTFLRYCQFQMDEIHILLLPPSSYNSVVCLLDVKEVGAKSKYIQQTCFLGELISSFLVTSQVYSFDLHMGDFQIGLQRESCISYVVSSTGLFVSIKMENLLSKNYCFSLPALCFSFSPADISFISFFYSFAYKESKYTRSGRQLWRIAASRISYLTPTPKLSWYRVTTSIKLWLYYLHTYENLLSIIGYPARDIVKQSCNKMFSDKKYSRSVKHHWDLISECEEQLPSEAIAQARRLIRYRVSESAQLAKQAAPEFKRIWWKVFDLLSLIWALTFCALHLFLRMLHLLRVHGHFRNQPEIIQHFKGVCDDYIPKCCFYLSVGKFSIALFPEKEVLQSVRGLSPSAVRFLCDDLISFDISCDDFLLKYLKSFSDCHVMFACGCVKVASSVLEDDHSNRRLREQWSKKILEPQDILWCEPAQSVEMVTSIPLLKFLVGQMWLNWKNARTNFERNDFKSSEAPCILFESKCSLIDQTANNPTCGFHEEVMVVGRLNFVLGNLAVKSLAVLFGQIQQASWRKGTKTVPDKSASHEILNSECKSVSSMIETTIYRMIPQMKFQLGLMIAGPRFRLSLRKEKFVGGNKDLHPGSKMDELELSFNLEDIELVISPNSVSKFTESSGDTHFCDEQPSSSTVEEPKYIDISKPADDYCCQWCISLNACLKFNGLKAFLSESSGNPGNEIFMSSPTTIWSSLFRKECHSLGSTIVATSATVHWIAFGFTAVVFLDELSYLVEVVLSLYDIVIHAVSFFCSSHDLSFQEPLRQDWVITYSDNHEVVVNRGKWTSVSVQSLFDFKSICELNSTDIVLYYSRKNLSGDKYVIQADTLTGQKLATGAVLDCGIYVSFQLAYGRFSSKDVNSELLIDLSGFRSVIVRCPIEITERSDKFVVKNLLLSMNSLLEASLSHCKFYFYTRTCEKSSTQEQLGNGADASTSCNSSCMDDDFNMMMKTEISRSGSFHWLIANISVGEIFLAEDKVKNVLVKSKKANNLNASFSVDEQFRTICCKSQGGSILLETEAVLVFVRCLTLYRRLIEDLLPSMSPPDKRTVSQYVKTVAAPDSKPAHDIQQLPKNKWHRLEEFRINLSQFSLVVVSRDEFGRFQELLFEANAYLNIEVTNMLRKVSFEVSKFSILSQFLHETAEQQYEDIQVSHFSSSARDELPPSHMVGDCSLIVEQGNTTLPLVNNSGFTSTSVQNEPFADNLKDSCTDDRGSTILYLSPQNYILKELCVVIEVERSTKRDGRDPCCLNQLWVGNGSVTGFDMNISLAQLQMMLSAVESISEVYRDDKTNGLSQRHFSMNQESEESLQGQVPDGIIVAIEDICQHAYIAVEDAESGYNLVGAVHYSLVGEKALFRVKHHNVQRWKPRVQYFSLISLYAKDAVGEPLILNGQSRSDFVDVSVSTDSAWALWSVIPYRPEACDGYFDGESDCFSMKNTFYLVNKKNDQSVAFIDGVLEFVSKPGNLFKWKLFHEPRPPGNNLSLTSCLMGAPGTDIQHNSHVNENIILSNSSKLRGITIVLDKATLTIVHELSDAKEKFPILQGSISSTEMILQISNTKARFMTWLERSCCITMIPRETYVESLSAQLKFASSSDIGFSFGVQKICLLGCLVIFMLESKS